MKKKIGIMLIVIMLVLSNVVLAEEEKFNVELTSSSNVVTQGESIELDVKVTNIKLQEGIISYIGEIEYDENVFQIESIAGTDSWKEPDVSSTKRKFLSYTKEKNAIKEDTVVAKIKLQAKETAATGDSEVKITMFEVANENESAKTTTERVAKINIQEKQETVPDEQEDNTNENTENNNNNSDQETDNNQNNQNNTEENNNNVENNNGQNTNTEDENTNKNTEENSDNTGNTENTDTENNTNDTNNEENNTQNETNNNTNEENKTTGTTDEENTMKGVIPQTGESNIIMPLILVTGITMIVFYRKYQKYREI